MITTVAYTYLLKCEEDDIKLKNQEVLIDILEKYEKKLNKKGLKDGC